MKLSDLYVQLYKKYGPQGWWPINNQYNKKDYSKKTEKEKFEIATGAILTQNTSWKNVEKALSQLREHEVLNKEAIRKINQENLAKLIKSSGYHNQKAKKLKECAHFEMTATRKNLVGIWGIGPETADSILLYAYNKPIFIVDAYTKRIMLHYKFGNAQWSYNQWQTFFHKNLDVDYRLFNEFHALIITHAKQLKRP